MGRCPDQSRNLMRLQYIEVQLKPSGSGPCLHVALAPNRNHVNCVMAGSADLTHVQDSGRRIWSGLLQDPGDGPLTLSIGFVGESPSVLLAWRSECELDIRSHVSHSVFAR